MSLQNLTKPEKNVVEFEFTVDKATFDAAVNKVYKKQVASITVPGFRKGKAPKSVIEKMYGKGVFYEDAINEILPKAYEDAYAEVTKDADFEIVSAPDIDIVSVDDNGVVFKAKVYTKPEVEIKNYKGIAATKKPVEVTEDEINAEIDRKLDMSSRRIDITDRAVANGDIVDIDFEGFKDDVAFEGGKGEHYELAIGSGSFIPGFEEQIIGKNIGDEFDINVTFPEEYHAEDLAGKPVVFKIKLHGIKVNEKPALDDEFAKDNGFDTLDEYKADVKAKIEDGKNKDAESAVEEQIINALIDNLEAEIPEAMFAAEVENKVRDLDNNLRMNGMDLGTYFKYTGLNLETVREQMRPQAERQVKTRLALEKIAELEKIEATADEIAAEYTKMSEAYNMEVDKIKEIVNDDGVAADLKVKKAVDFVKENAKITVSAEEAPAKKPAAKKTTTKSTTAKKTTAKKSEDAAEEKAPAKKTTTKKATTTKTATTKKTTKKADAE